MGKQSGVFDLFITLYLLKLHWPESIVLAVILELGVKKLANKKITMGNINTGDCRERHSDYVHTFI
jgi:hypothetical protein